MESTSTRSQHQDMKDLLDRFEGIHVLDKDGQSVEFNSLIRDNRACIALLRHYGWNLCKREAAQLAKRYEDFQRANTRLIALSPGATAEQTKEFVEETKFPGEAYADKENKIYSALNLKRGFFATLFAKGAWTAYKQATSEGFQASGIKGDPFQLGGMLVVDPQAGILMEHHSQNVGDYPPVDDVLQLCSPAEQ